MASNDAGPLTAPPSKTVVYRRYDPALIARDKRLSQLSNASLNAGRPGRENRRVLGSSTAAQSGPLTPSASSVSYFPSPRTIQDGGNDHTTPIPKVRVSADGAHGTAWQHDVPSTVESLLPASSGVLVAARAPHGHAAPGQLTPLNSGDYFVPAHTESTTDRMVLRGIEREYPHPPSKAASATLGLGESTHAGSDINGRLAIASSHGAAANGSMYEPFCSPSGLPMAHSPNAASTFTSVSSHTHSEGSSSTAWHGRGPPSNMSISPRGSPNIVQQSTLQATGSATYQEYRPFIPPSAYVTSPARSYSTSSSASSPDVLASQGISPGSGAQLAAHVANQLSSAFQRGLNGVNEAVASASVVPVNSNIPGGAPLPAPLRFPQSASNIASAMWNRLPPAMQALKQELSESVREVRQQSSEIPSAGFRSLSAGSLFNNVRTTSMELYRDISEAQRPGSSSSFGSSSENVSFAAIQPTPLPIAAQLRLDHESASQMPAALRSASAREISSSHQSHIHDQATANMGRTSSALRNKAPYKAGYQPPNGVRRSRTEQFLHLRQAKHGVSSFSGIKQGVGNRSTIEDDRLLRRLDKLVALHFSPSPRSDIDQSERRRSLVHSSSLTSVSSLPADLSSRTSPARKPARPLSQSGGMMRGLVRGMSRVGIVKTKPKDHEGIVKWQEDSEVSRCPICYAPFNMLTRKHHCRLCGRVVCFLPPNMRDTGRAASDGQEISPQDLLPKRLVRCSTFVMYDRHSAIDDRASAGEGLDAENIANTPPCLTLGTIREVDLGDKLSGSDNADPSAIDPRLLAIRAAEINAGVRICRDCLDTIGRKQKRGQSRVTEPWARLYKSMTQLQNEIELSFPLLSELRSVLPVTRESVAVFTTTRKRLLQNLANYDLLAKRLRDLPSSEPATPLSLSVSGSTAANQDRLQKAIFARASLFLAEKTLLLKSIPPPQLPKLKTPQSETASSAASMISVDPKLEEQRAARLAVLYEQEALVSGYLEDAQVRRQFEDASALKTSLEELRAEIENLVA